MGYPLTEPLARRWQADPSRCGCPLASVPCEAAADGEDRLCSVCRDKHRPDFRQQFADDEDWIDVG